MLLQKNSNLALLLTIILITSCNQEIVCTDIQQNNGIKIVDQENNPVSSVDLDIINERTGNKICAEVPNISSCEDELGEIGDTGNYIIITSLNTLGGEIKDLDTIEVTGTKGTASFTQEYIVRLTSNGCHPKEILGPETVVMIVSGN